MAASSHTDDNCIFCKIIKGDIPSFKLIETDAVCVHSLPPSERPRLARSPAPPRPRSYSFLDIGPIAPGHALVIPKCASFSHSSSS